MIHFIKNITLLLYLLFIVSKHGILYHISYSITNIPTRLKYCARIVHFIFYPVYRYHKSTLPFCIRLTNCLQELGPAYIKLGQTLATRSDIISTEIAATLKTLQDQLPPFPTEQAKEIIQSSLQRNINDIFTVFPDDPVSAASIAQVYKAQLADGKEVAVKVLRPNIKVDYLENIITLYFIADILAKFVPKMKRLKLVSVIDVLKDSMLREIDLRIEASSCSEMLNNLKNDNYIHIPQIYWEFISEKVLVIEWIEGVSIREKESIINLGISLRKLAERIIITFFNQAYHNGFFHADLHQGNIIVMPDGKIGLIDFGIVGRLTEKDRIAVAEILFAFLRRDYYRVAEIHLNAGYIPLATDLDLFAQYCRAVAEPIIGIPLKDVSLGNLLAQLFQITEDFGMETQPQLLLLQKTMVVVEGISKNLYPEVNVWKLLEPWIKKWAIKNISPEAKILKFIYKYFYDLINQQY